MKRKDDKSLEESILIVKSEIEKKYPYIHVGYDWNEENEKYYIWHTNKEIDLTDEFISFVYDLINRLRLDDFVYFGYNYSRTIEFYKCKK